ncbi:hypothetical protein FQN54_009221 [Arachnomyces sp. PD_36]|nr:hypothetical protein FQN54_009221 [Arachnomyces sp. PD_36]
MKLSTILAVVFSTASVVHAVAVDKRDPSLEVRGCGYDDCDDCHSSDPYCVNCDNGGGIGVSCAVCLAHCDPCC